VYDPLQRGQYWKLGLDRAVIPVLLLRELQPSAAHMLAAEERDV
jgi:hypothetical protein